MKAACNIKKVVSNNGSQDIVMLVSDQEASKFL